jgi:tripartite-type tricarboxylate transporter receptor subunit TctC
VVDLAGDRLTFMFTVLPAVKSLIQGGRLKLIAQATPSRLPEFPDLPTVAESGVPGFESSIWYGLVAPAGTPRTVVEKLHAELTAIIKSPRMHSRMVMNGTYPIGDTQAEFARTITSDIVKYAEVIRAAGIKAD